MIKILRNFYYRKILGEKILNDHNASTLPQFGSGKAMEIKKTGGWIDIISKSEKVPGHKVRVVPSMGVGGLVLEYFPAKGVRTWRIHLDYIKLLEMGGVNIIEEMKKARIKWFTVLGVGETASKDDIKGAHRELSKKYHPDVTEEEDVVAAERYAQVQKAYKEGLAAIKG